MQVKITQQPIVQQEIHSTSSNLPKEKNSNSKPDFETVTLESQVKKAESVPIKEISFSSSSAQSQSKSLNKEGLFEEGLKKIDVEKIKEQPKETVPEKAKESQPVAKEVIPQNLAEKSSQDIANHSGSQSNLVFVDYLVKFENVQIIGGLSQYSKEKIKHQEDPKYPKSDLIGKFSL